VGQWNNRVKGKGREYGRWANSISVELNMAIEIAGGVEGGAAESQGER